MGQHSVITLPDAEIIAAKVAKGAKLLDERAPGWRLRVDGAMLDCENGPELNCPHHGLLGQAFGVDDLHQVSEALGFGDGHADQGRSASEQITGHGFMYDLYDGFRAVTDPMQALMAEFMGVPMGYLGGVLSVAIPRDQDEMLMEASALIEAWRQELANA